jgi:TonB-linked SusC/RagA family outer membrane protein
MRQKYLFSLLIFLITATQVLLAQEITITGTVTDNTGAGLPGVNVLVKGTSNGTATDFDGRYEIKASQGDVLEFSFIGFETKDVKVTGSTINVSLTESANELDEVVVTAFGITKKTKELGYSVTQVKTADLDLAGQTNSVTALQGRVAGLAIRQTSGSPGGGVDILIRGMSSLTPGSNNQPLIVVDGVAINNDTFSGNVLPSAGSNAPSSSEQFSYSSRAGDINPEDIESYNVLKGAAATALYGIQGANGVIVITTKKGKQGRAKINFSASTTFRKVTKTPEQQKLYREGYNGKPEILYTPETETGFTRVSPSTPFHTWGPLYSDDVYEYPDYSVDLSNDRFYDPYELFKTGVNSQINFNISGASETLDYFFSMGRSSDESIVPNSNYDKLSFRFNGGFRVSETFKISSSVQFTNSGGRRANGGDKSIISSLAYFSPTFPVNDYKNADGSQRNYTPWIDNPRYFAEVSSLEDDVNRWIGNVNFNWAPADWVNVNYTAQIDNYSDHRNRFVPPELDTGTKVHGFIINENILYTGLESNFIVSFNHDFSEKIHSSLTLGNQVQDYKRNYDRMYGEGLNLPHFNHISNTAIRDNSNSLSHLRNIGLFGEFKIDYDNVLFLTVTGRNDWVSTLPSDNNSFFYPSVSLAYDIHSLFGDQDFFTFGKLRASYAEVGKGTRFGQVGSYYVPDGDFPWGSVGGYRADTSIGDPNLQPQRMKGWEVGADLRFFKNRLRFDYAYYSNLVTNQIFGVSQPYSTGLTSLTRNAGDYENWGHELMISGDIIKNDKMNWELIYNFSKNEGLAKDLPDDIEYVQFYGDGAPELFLRLKEGDKMGTLYGYNWRYENGERYIDKNGYPTLARDDGYQIVGNALPDFVMSLGSNLRWGAFGFNFLVEWKEGGDKYSWARRTMIRNGNSILTELRIRDDSYVLPGVMEDPASPGSYIPNTTGTRWGLDETYYRSWSRYTGAAEVYLQDASWVKLRNIGFSYDLSGHFLDKMHVRTFVLSVNANNIILWTPYDGYDPEGSAFSAGSNIYGFSGKGIPLTENYSFGIKIGF